MAGCSRHGCAKDTVADGVAFGVTTDKVNWHWLCHDDNTMKIVINVTIVLIKKQLHFIAVVLLHCCRSLERERCVACCCNVSGGRLRR